MTNKLSIFDPNPQKVLAISFVTRPSEGSEGGVGWSFVKAAAVEVLQNRFSRMDFIFDKRDYKEVKDAVSLLPGSDRLVLHPVELPSVALRKFGNRRTRLSYLSWLPFARKKANVLHQMHGHDVVHQFTFATSSLPSALPRGCTNSIWGPVAAPEGTVAGWDSRASAIESGAVLLGVKGSKRFARKAHRVICQNDYTQDLLSKEGYETVLEPNIFVEPNQPTDRNSTSLVFSGNLIDRKRPWIALQALNHPSLRDYHLDFIGSGPLLSALESYTRQERLSSRVSFLGRLPRHEAIAKVGQSAVLVLPSVREGAGWVVGEAASRGTPSVVFNATGAATVVRLSGNMGTVVEKSGTANDQIEAFREGIVSTLAHREWSPTDRWSERRIPGFLRKVWHGPQDFEDPSERKIAD